MQYCDNIGISTFLPEGLNFSLIVEVEASEVTGKELNVNCLTSSENGTSV